MKLYKTLDNIGDFAFGSGLIFVKKNQTEIIHFTSEFKQVFSADFGEAIQDLNVSCDIVYTNTAIDGLGRIIKDSIVEKKKFFINYIDDKKNIFGNSHNGSIKEDEFANTLWEKSDRIFTFNISNNYLFYKKEKNLISAISYLNGNEIWQYTLPEMEIYLNNKLLKDIEVSKIIGVFKDTLWIILNTGFILGIDTISGILLYFLKTPINWDKEFFRAPNYNAILDKGEGKMFGIQSTYYWEIDLNNPNDSYLYYDISVTCNNYYGIENSIVQQVLSWQNNEIFIGQQELGHNPSFVGIFNRTTKEMSWSSHEMKGAGIFKGLRKIEMNGSLLYVLDATNTLYVFERS